MSRVFFYANGGATARREKRFRAVRKSKLGDREDT